MRVVYRESGWFKIEGVAAKNAEQCKNSQKILEECAKSSRINVAEHLLP